MRGPFRVNFAIAQHGDAVMFEVVVEDLTLRLELDSGLRGKAPTSPQLARST